MGEFIVKTKTLDYKTKKRLEFIKITNKIEDFVRESGVKNGSVLIQTHHTTCSVWINEDEKNLIGSSGDLKKVLDRFASPEDEYGHNDIKDVNNPEGKRDTHLCEPDSCGVVSECANGHAHAQGMILPCSLNLIISDGELVKGRWQEILLIELDHNRDRKITILVQGIS